MSTSCSAFAYAIELSERTFAATAALIGAARLALMSAIAARSGRGSPAISSSSSRLSCLYSCGVSVMFASLRLRRAGRLRDVRRLLGVRVRDRVVREDVQRGGDVHGRGHVRVDERHGGALGELLARDLVQLLAGERAELVRCLGHAVPPLA